MPTFFRALGVMLGVVTAIVLGENSMRRVEAGLSDNGHGIIALCILVFAGCEAIDLFAENRKPRGPKGPAGGDSGA